MTGANCQTITNVTFGDGQSLSGTGCNCVDANPLHFTGQQWDSESGLHYFPARHYSTQFGRFMSPDPAGIFLGNLNDPESLNLYAYVRNNSPSMTDPSGLCDDFVSTGTCGDFGISVGFDWGWWGSANSGAGPDGPLNIPANIGPNPNPFSGLVNVQDPGWFIFSADKCPNGDCAPTQPSVGVGGGVWEIPGLKFIVDAWGAFWATKPLVVKNDIPIYGLHGHGAQVLRAAGDRATHDLGCVGLGGVVAGGSAAALAPVIPKPFSAGGTSGTSLASTVLGGGNIGRGISTPVGMPGTSSFTWRSSANLGRIAGRYLPYVGTAVGAAATYACLSN